MTWEEQNHDQNMRQDTARFARVEAKIEGNTNALEAMQTRKTAMAHDLWEAAKEKSKTQFVPEPQVSPNRPLKKK